MKIFITLSFMLLGSLGFAVTPKTELVYKGAKVVWGFAFLSKTELLITHREGKLYYYDTISKEEVAQPVPTISRNGWQSGLLDIIVNEEQGKTFVYITFTEKVNGQHITSLAKGEFKNKKIQNLNTIFRATLPGDTGFHFGSRLAIKGDHLFMTIGDRGFRDMAQDNNYHNGTILRLTLDGKAAPGNPFINKPNALPEIWTFGHRNPQGIDFDPVTGELYSCEFGPKGGDEVNLIKPGNNYGWPVITYGTEYGGDIPIGTTHKEGMEQPVAYWTPSISPSGMVFYRGDKIPQWKNNLFLANLSSEHLRRLVLVNNQVVKQEVLFANLNERVRQVRNSPDGYLHFSTDAGHIYRVFDGNVEKANP